MFEWFEYENRNDTFDDEILSDENEVTIQQTSVVSDQISTVSNHTPLLIRVNNEDYCNQSKSDGYSSKELTLKYSPDNKSLK